MLLKILKSNQPIEIIFIFILCLLQWTNSFIEPNVYYFSFDSYKMPLYSALLNFLDNKKLLSVLVAFILLIAESSILVRLNTKYIFINSRTYFPALTFSLISGSYIELQRLHPVIIANLFLLLAINRLFATYKHNISLSKVFDTAFFLSLGSMFYANMIFFMIIIWIGIFILKQFQWREWLVSVLGFFLPYLFLYTYYLYSGNNINIFNLFAENLLFNNSILYTSKYYMVYFWIIALIVIISSYYMITVFQHKKISSRKYFLIFWWLFVSIILMYLFLPSASVELIVFLSVPLSYILTNYFIFVKSNWRTQALLYVFLMASILLQKFI